MYKNISCQNLLEEIDKSSFFDLSLFKNHLESCNKCNNSIETKEIFELSEKIKSLKEIKTSESFMLNLDKKINDLNLEENQEKKIFKNALDIISIFSKKQNFLIAASIIIFLGLFNLVSFLNIDNKNYKIIKNQENLIVYNRITKYMMNMEITNNSQPKSNYLLKKLNTNQNKSIMIMYNDKL